MGATLGGGIMATVAYSFGSLTIASGGTYSATSGTTTINGDDSGSAWANLETDGTGFVHNNGLVHFNYTGDATAGSVTAKENVWYDVKISMYASTHDCTFWDTTGAAITILGNLDVVKGEQQIMSAGDTFTVHGLTNISADGTFEGNADQTGQITHHGLVTNLGVYKINDTTTVKMNGGFRQLNTLTIA